MKNITEQQDQDQDPVQPDPPMYTDDERSLAVGLERATEIATAGASAVVAPGRSRQTGDRVYSGIVRLAVWIFLFVLTGIALVLITQSVPAFQVTGFSFLTSSSWDPVNDVYGVAPVIIDTLIVAGVAMILASVVGLSASIFVVEYSPRWLREPVAFLIELLAYIPSVVYGLWALLVMSPFLQSSVQPWIQQNLGFIPFFNGPPYGVGVMAATLILSIMLLPLIVSLSREALLLVPDSQREAMLALGATRWEVLRQAVIPYARTGIFGAIILSMGRALGETIAVAMVIGGGHVFLQTAFDQGYTLSSVIANEFNEASSDIYRSALILTGLILFLITAVVNIVAFFLLRRMNRIGNRARA